MLRAFTQHFLFRSFPLDVQQLSAHLLLNTKWSAHTSSDISTLGCTPPYSGEPPGDWFMTNIQSIMLFAIWPTLNYLLLRKCCSCILSTLKKGPFFGLPLLASSTNIRLPGRAQVQRPHILYAPWNLIPETDAGNFSLVPTKFEALWKVLLNWSSLESQNSLRSPFLYFLFMPAGSGAGDESKLLRKCSTFNSSVMNVEHNETT